MSKNLEANTLLLLVTLVTFFNTGASIVDTYITSSTTVEK